MINSMLLTLLELSCYVTLESYIKLHLGLALKSKIGDLLNTVSWQNILSAKENPHMLTIP
ncbi:hypothetical protein QQ045_020167 [Rhodiola kirilowii]